MLRLVGTIARVIFGFALASIAAGLVTVLFVNTPADVLAEPASRLPQAASDTFELALLTATHAALFAAIFVVIVAFVSEWLSIRALSFFLICGVVIALLGFTAQYASEVAGQPTIMNNYAVTAFLTTGFFAGFVYWLAAGQFAGRPADSQTATLVTQPVTAAVEEIPEPLAKEAAREEEPVDDRAAVSSAAAVPKPGLRSLMARLKPRRSSAPEAGDEPVTDDDAPQTEALEPPQKHAAEESVASESGDVPATEPPKYSDQNDK